MRGRKELRRGKDEGEGWVVSESGGGVLATLISWLSPSSRGWGVNGV